MASQVVAFLRRSRRRGTDWSQEEVAELYRIEHALLQARFALETDRGVSDEGDPWFVFCRADGEVLVHITRSEEGYLLYGLGLSRPLTGRVIGDISKSFVNQIPLNIPVRQKDGPQLFVHPAAALAIIVGMIFLANDDVALISSDHASAASAGDGAELVDRTVKASVVAVLGKLADGTLFGGARLETGHQDGNYLSIVCTIAAVMMGASVALDAGIQETPAVVGNVAEAGVEPTQTHQASPGVADSAIAIRSEGAMGGPLSADHATALPFIPLDEAAPSESVVVHNSTVAVQDTPQPKAASDAVASLGGPHKSDFGIDEAVFGLPRPLADIEARGHTEVSQHAEVGRPPAVLAPTPVATAVETGVEVAKQASSDAPSRATSVRHEDAGASLPDAQFHELFKSAGLPDTVQVDRVVAHATLETLQGLVQPVTGSAAKAEPVSLPQADGRGLAAAADEHVSSGRDGAAAHALAVATAAPADVAPKPNPVFDEAARDILTRYFQENPNAQAIFFQNNALIFDPSDYGGPDQLAVKIWETAAGDTITLVGYASDLALHT